MKLGGINIALRRRGTIATPAPEAAPVVQNERSFTDPPDVVTVYSDGLAPTNSGFAPEYYSDAELLHRFNALIDEYHSTNNYIALFYALPEVFAPIHEIASRVADAVWQLRRNRDDAPVYDDETFNRLFSSPNPIQSTKQLIYNSVCYEILTGKLMWYLNQPILPQDYTTILSWFVLPSHQVNIEMRRGVDLYSTTEVTDLISRYSLPRQGNTPRTFDVDRVIAILHTGVQNCKNLNNTQPLIKGADKAIKNLIPVYQARGLIYMKQGALGFLVNRAKDANGPMLVTEQHRKELAAAHTTNYGITGNKSPIGLVSTDVDFVRTALTIKELEPFEETLADALAIYAVLGVPPHLVPNKNKSTFNNADADMKNFYTGIIIPWAMRYAEKLNNRIKIPNRYIYPDFSHIGFLQENLKDKSITEKTFGGVWKERFMAGICSLNEWIGSWGGTKGVGPLYDKKLLEMTPEELEQIKPILNNGKGNPSPEATPEETGEPGGAVQ